MGLSATGGLKQAAVFRTRKVASQALRGYAWGLSQQEMRKGRGNISYLSGWPDQSQCTALQQNRLRYLIPKPKHPGTAVSESL